MKLCKEELSIIKDVIGDFLADFCLPNVNNHGAKEIAYLPMDKFEDGYSQTIKWAQLVLRKTIQEIVDLNEIT